MNNNIPEGWTITTLGSFMDFKNGINAEKDAYGKGVRFVNVNDIFKKNTLTKNDVTESVSITEKQLDKYSVIKGDILFNRTSETPKEIAFSSVYVGDETITFGGFVIRGRQRKTLLIPEYAKYCFKLNTIRKKIIRCCQGAIRANIGQKDLSKVPIVIPPKEDQLLIFSTLNEWETMIEKTETLIALKEKQFLWLQNHITDTDFSNYKNYMYEYSNIQQSKKITSVDGLKPLTVKLYCKGIEPNEKDIPITLSKKGRPYFQRFAGEFLIGRQSFHNGGFGIVPEELNGFIASNAITSLDINASKLDTQYLFYFFSRKNYYLRIGHTMNGTCQKELSEKQIMKLPVSIPNLKKQQEVVKILNTAKEEINILKNLANKYRTQKRVLTQKLLSGKWRVKADILNQYSEK